MVGHEILADYGSVITCVKCGEKMVVDTSGNAVGTIQCPQCEMVTFYAVVRSSKVTTYGQQYARRGC